MKRPDIVFWVFGFCFSACLFWVVSCSNNKPAPTDNPTSGEITIASDESFYPLCEAELDVFHALYKYAKIKPIYTPEDEAFEKLIADSVRLVLATRKLKPEEVKYFEQIKIIPRITLVATDAVALVVHPENKDTLITIPQLGGILSGQIRTWKELGSVKKTGSVQLVFDNNRSSNLRLLKEVTGIENNLSNAVFSLKGNQEVMEYVGSHPDAIGVIGVNWISDGDDPKMLSFLKTIRVMSVSKLEKPASPDDYYLPYQAYVAQDNYPLKRSLYIVSREARMGLGTGFASFMASERGQRIILKMGLVPATMPLRIVKVTNHQL